MNPEEAGTEHTLFFDTYALYAIAVGQESYEPFSKGIHIVTTLMNLCELYYKLYEDGFVMEAEKFFERFLPYCALIEPHIVKEAARFRLRHKKLSLSYVDALGYLIAQEKGILFLTGDHAFEKMNGVKFVK